MLILFACHSLFLIPERAASYKKKRSRPILPLSEDLKITISFVVGKDVKKMELLCTVGGIVNWCSHYGNSMEVSQAIPLWVFIQRNTKH